MMEMLLDDDDTPGLLRGGRDRRLVQRLDRRHVDHARLNTVLCELLRRIAHAADYVEVVLSSTGHV